MNLNNEAPYKTMKKHTESEQAFPFDYSCGIENGIFCIKLYIPEKPDDLKTSYALVRKEQSSKTVETIDGTSLSASFEIKCFGIYYINVTLKSKGEKFRFSTDRYDFTEKNAISYLTFNNHKYFEQCRDNLNSWYLKKFNEQHLQAEFVNPLINFRIANPNIHIIVHNRPRLPQDKRTAHEQNIVDNLNGYREAKKFLAAMRENPPRMINRAWDDLGYERPELIADCITHTNYKPYLNKQGVFTAHDDATPFCNILDGHRVTHHQPREYDRTIWHIGFSHVFGYGAPDWGTIDSFLQEILNERVKNEAICVENYGYVRMSSFVDQAMKIANFLSRNFRDNDIVLIQSVTGLPGVHDVLDCDLSEILQRPHNHGECFFDRSHLNEKGNRVFAEGLYDFIIENKLLEMDHGIGARQKPWPDTGLPKEQIVPLHQYLDQIAPLRPRVGAIVMNCNPFTLGHRYLIEQSAEKVTKLFVFVVEEDKSVFPFIDRMELLRLGTSDLGNVEIIPSGKFIISTLTFVDYFGKSDLQDMTIDPSMDVRLFGQYIAPKLGINMRFAGDEPLDKVTRQYNEAMARILPEYGIDFGVLPRKEVDGNVISASRVRELLAERNFSEIAKLVPATTLAYLTKVSL